MNHALSLASALSLFAFPAAACDATPAPAAGPIRAEAPFSRATPGRARVGGAFMTLVNEGPTDDRLVSASTDAAARVEIHTHVVEQGMMRMSALPDGLALPAGGEAVLAPGGDHLMLMGLSGPLVEGDCFEAVLTFEAAPPLTIRIPVAAIAARSAPNP